jgi:acetoin utilization deacetylase AcuC-like enzyme
VKLLGEHEEESSQKITELDALCKKLREDTQRLEEEKATLEEMVEFHDELIMEIARETGLDHMGEDEYDEDEEEDANDGGDAMMKKAMWRRSVSKKPRCCMWSCWQMLSLRCHNSISTMHS